ncbi:MAG: helix-turn-helix domain-containing protein [Spirochaetaceae bacterium]|nr:MAG: helix-turn-helix domain-containing protein [Spirochaetaceae bacterium]
MLSLELLAMLGAMQGLLLLVLIAVRFRSRRNLPLALLLLTFSIRLGTIPYWTPDGLLGAPWILTIVGALPLLFGPLVWWYVRELIREDLRAPRLMLLHVSPWLLETIVFVAVVLLIGQEGYQHLVDDVFTAPAPGWLHARNALKGIVNGAYAIAAAHIVFGRESRSAHVTASRRIWARAVVILPLLCLLSFLGIALDPSAEATASQAAICPFTVSAAIMAATVYAFAFLAILRPDVLDGTHTAQQASSRYEMDGEQIADIIREVEQSIAGGVFRDPELSLLRLAKQLEVHPNRLSHAINRGFDCTFTQLVNRARLEDFLRRVDAGELERFTMLSLALESGFRSKSTFNRVFKENYGISPSEYLDQRRLQLT